VAGSGVGTGVVVVTLQAGPGLSQEDHEVAATRDNQLWQGRIDRVTHA
jgi:hypothetical protein